ncbi:hypothetical protein QOZ80_2BG0166900 [Eleusine coracana subsp. coracana]|nr:hypothetical protein QOZ80_2BG0166900 [Eleusine coracana subsp. coracana]
MNTWSHFSRTSVSGKTTTTDRPPPPEPVPERWFPDTCPIPVPLPFARLDHVVKRCHHAPLPVDECFFHFSAESVKKLKARTNAEVTNSSIDTATKSTTVTTISSLQAVLAHLWRAVCRARKLSPSQPTTYVLFIGCRGRVKGVPPSGYVGNAVVPCKVTSTAGDVVERGLGWAALQLNRAVASYNADEAAMVRDSVEKWVREPRFAYTADMLSGGSAAVGTGGSPRFDVYGNDFGWGMRPVAVRSGPANKMDGKTTVYQGRGGGGAVGLEVCLAPDALTRLVDDKEFMDAVTVP